MWYIAERGSTTNSSIDGTRIQRILESAQRTQPLVANDDSGIQTPSIVREALTSKQKQWNEAQQIALVN